VPPGVSVIVVSHNTRSDLDRCLTEIGDGHELIVVDSGSSDGSPELVRERFAHARLIALDDNPGYGAAANVGIERACGDYVLVLNADAWPLADAIASLISFAEREPRAGVVGPRLLNPDGTLQRSVRGFPTVWRLATEYLFLRWFAPRSRALNAFYGSGFDHRTPRDAEFLVGAALLVRRDALEDVGAFDADFFMFDEEVDLCYRMHAAGWRVLFDPDSQFVHVGGASTRQVPTQMYREQLRSHLRFLAKHHGVGDAERARRLLVAAMRVRAVVFAVVRQPERRTLSLDAAAWLRSSGVNSLLDQERPASVPVG